MRYDVLARRCANPDCGKYINPDRVRARPNIKTCSPACRTAVWKLNRGYVHPDAGDGAETPQTPRKRKGGGPRGVDLPWRRSVAQLAADYQYGFGLTREAAVARAERVLARALSALTGIRRAESARRSKRHPINRKGSMVFCNPLIDWTDYDMRRYRAEHDLPESDVSALLHRSGECNCGCFADEGEREMLRALWPDWFDERIGALEREAEAMDLPCARWGGDRTVPAVEAAGELCSTCEHRQLSMEETA